jgi:hypothetical protein
MGQVQDTLMGDSPSPKGSFPRTVRQWATCLEDQKGSSECEIRAAASGEVKSTLAGA